MISCFSSASSRWGKQLLDTARLRIRAFLFPCQIRPWGVGEICTFQRCGALPSSGDLAQSHCNCPCNVQRSATTRYVRHVARGALNPLIYRDLKILSTSISTCIVRNLRDLGKGIAYFNFSEEMTPRKQSGGLSYGPRCSEEKETSISRSASAANSVNRFLVERRGKPPTLALSQRTPHGGASD